MRGVWAGVGVVAIAVAGWLAPGTAPAAPLPSGFFGVVPQAPLRTGDFERMRGTVGTLRLTFDWGELEPRPGTWEFGELDRLIGAATRRGIRVMALLYGLPDWLDGGAAARPPRGVHELAAWQRFVRETVRRYGAGGTFWGGRPRPLPVRRWQVWNEPNFLLFWHPEPEPRQYVGLLRETARTIRGADRGALVVAAGVAPVQGGMRPADFLAAMYAAPGARRAFDLMALHPYSYNLAQLSYQVREIRTEMAVAGDGGKPLLISEIGVASAADEPTRFDKERRGQARFLRGALGLLLERRRDWRIAGVEWFSWADGVAADPHCPFCQASGLFDRAGTAKPAWHAFQRVVAGAKLGGTHRVGSR